MQFFAPAVRISGTRPFRRPHRPARGGHPNDTRGDFPHTVCNERNPAYEVHDQTPPRRPAGCGRSVRSGAQYGYSDSYDAAQLDEEIRNMLLPLLNLEEDMYTDFAASVSGMMVQSYGIAIVKPAEGKADAVKQALQDFVTHEQMSMEHYLEDQYQIAKAAKVEVLPSGEVVLVCCENSDAVLSAIKTALAA